jgi:hypothetical protein
MLKRARCTIYMAQDGDTIGKDSELAVTLAQGRPVIVYVPTINVESYAAKIEQYPLEYFYRRLLLLKVDEVLSDSECAAETQGTVPNFRELADRFVRDFEQYRRRQPLKLWRARDEAFKLAQDEFRRLCVGLAIAEKHAANKRAKVLKDFHPLALQVDLKTGVAVGVLVVRSAAECIATLRSILLNELDFRIEPRPTVASSPEPTAPLDPGVIVLRDTRTGSQYRVVTRNESLANAFWNHFTASSSAVHADSARSSSPGTQKCPTHPSHRNP